MGALQIFPRHVSSKRDETELEETLLPIDFRYPEIFPGELKSDRAVKIAAFVSELISAEMSADKRKQWTNGNRKRRFSLKLKWDGEK